jgi:hypothetical protein
MKRHLFTLALAASLFPVLGGCHVYYFAHARVPLSAPADTSCLRSTLVDNRPFGSLGSRQIAGGRSTAVGYSTPAMFHDRWETVTQVIQRDSSIHRGEIFQDSSATLGTTYVQLDRRIDPGQAASTTAQMAQFLLDLRDTCGGRSPGDERLFSVAVEETPYRAWVVRGTNAQVRMRLTVDSRQYRLHWPQNAGRYVLRVDTLADDSEPRYLRWAEADTMLLPSPQKGTTLATDCWRGEALPSSDLVALTRKTNTQYFTEVLDAWALDRAALRIRPVPITGVECRNTDWGSMLPDAPFELRTAALTFRPSPGMARIYAYLSDLPTERAITQVAVDSQLVGWIGGGSFLMVEVEPGPHRVSAPAGRHESALWLDAAPDSVYFVELRKNRLAWSLASSWRAKVREMDPVEARNAIRRAHMVHSSWPGTPMRKRE